MWILILISSLREKQETSLLKDSDQQLSFPTVNFFSLYNIHEGFLPWYFNHGVNNILKIYTYGKGSFSSSGKPSEDFGYTHLYFSRRTLGWKQQFLPTFITMWLWLVPSESLLDLWGPPSSTPPEGIGAPTAPVTQMTASVQHDPESKGSEVVSYGNPSTGQNSVFDLMGKDDLSQSNSILQNLALGNLELRQLVIETGAKKGMWQNGVRENTARWCFQGAETTKKKVKVRVIWLMEKRGDIHRENERERETKSHSVFIQLLPSSALPGKPSH